MRPSSFTRRRPRPATGRSSRWTPSMFGSCRWGQLRTKVKSISRTISMGSRDDLDCQRWPSTAASVGKSSGRTLREFDGVVCGACSGSMRREDMPSVPDLPDSSRASAGSDSSMRRLMEDAPMRQSSRAGIENRTVKDFEIVKTLGEGSMGLVLMVKLANDRGTPYALKITDKGRFVREHQVGRMMQESELLRRASHPFVVRLIDAFQDDASLFMLTEYAGGGDLFSAMQNAKFDEVCAHFFGAEVALALGHIHSLDIAYRDLKPENVVIDSLGHAKIIDFGLAKVIQTRTYTVCGTLEYMAPEVLSQVGHGQCVDWWALGILIFEMLAFRAPFTGRTARETRRNVIDRDPRCPQYFGSVAKGIVYLLLIKDQGLRLGSGADGTRRVQSHPWFSTVEWGDLLRQKCASPFSPAGG
ncbi:unnamed protein product [Prorocentrum cordatum]|uniref:Protein kinase domain-containing protein n=1 Tax=Prorocentrum cordatum TaxID=2364126 RepID=A0ABN9RL97_9DINO|nr:unnamed protein product [Polarella glacialis]